METRSSIDATQILPRVVAGDHAAADRLLALVYDDLRALAGNMLRRERPDHTLQPTALVHEVYLRLIDQSRVQWQDRRHFIAVASMAMRRLLADSARRRRAEKHGGGQERITFDPAVMAGSDGEADVVVLDDLLTTLSGLHERQSRIVEMRLFGGLSVGDVADLMSISKSTVESDWRMARAWLITQLRDGRA